MTLKLLSKIDPHNTVSFTGHRANRLPRGEQSLLHMQRTLTKEIENAILRGKVNFASGIMSGFDVIAAEQMIHLKDKYPQIKCILVAPFTVRFFDNKNWPQEWKRRAMAICEKADFAESLSKHYYRGVYYERDRVLVDISSEIIAYYTGGMGGTKFTIDYAYAQNKTVINIAKC